MNPPDVGSARRRASYFCRVFVERRIFGAVPRRLRSEISRGHQCGTNGCGGPVVGLAGRVPRNPSTDLSAPFVVLLASGDGPMSLAEAHASAAARHRRKSRRSDKDRPGGELGEHGRRVAWQNVRVTATETVTLDPVYTSQAMTGLLGHIHRMRWPRTTGSCFSAPAACRAFSPPPPQVQGSGSMARPGAESQFKPLRSIFAPLNSNQPRESARG